MDRDQFEVALQVMLEATHEQQSQPLMMALAVLTVELSRDPQVAQRLAIGFRASADSCPPDVHGRLYLAALAELAGGPSPASPDDVQSALRSQLRLIRGGQPD